MAKLFIFGTSGFAREIRDVAYELGWESVFIAESRDARDAASFDEQIILESDIGTYADAAFAIGIGDGKVRQKIVSRFGGALNFINLIHPTATFGKDQKAHVESRRGIIICAGVRFMSGIKLGDYAVFSLNATIGHDTVIQDYVSIMPGANVAGYVEIEQYCWIGANAAINQGNATARLKIGAGTTVGAGAVVTKACAPESIYVGVPARKL
jgi:sugar O-acyltransferase (sialic acid O-acetyltransferase NeuD family)